MNKKAQQEMVGFVLIIILVVVGLVVFLVINLNQKTELKQNQIANNVLSSIMDTTSQCSVSYAENYETIRDLFKYCYENKQCKENNQKICDYLNSTLTQLMDKVLLIDATISAYELDFVNKDTAGQTFLLKIINGKCVGTLYGSEPQVISLGADEGLIITLKICQKSNIND